MGRRLPRAGARANRRPARQRGCVCAPAGHILGSAQIRIERGGEVWVASGDYKRAADPTCTPFEPVRCHTFITEATFALPIYTWDPTSVVIDDLLAWRRANREAARPSVVFCYVLGKAQRLLAELCDRVDEPVRLHGAVAGLTQLYREAGVRLAPTERITEDMRGAALATALVLAPLSARGSTWMRRLPHASDAFASGLMRVRGVRRQRGFDRGFVLSDHADWPALLATIAETGASRVLVTHGWSEALARYLAEARGSRPASCAQPMKEKAANWRLTPRPPLLWTARRTSCPSHRRRGRREAVHGAV